MNEIVTMAPHQVLPDAGPVLEALGVPKDRLACDRTRDLYEAAAEVFVATAAPIGCLGEITSDEFAAVYLGEGRNHARTPVGDLIGRADALALFAVTVGEGVGRAITNRFHARDFAVGYVLDALASVATEKAADVAERRFRERLGQRGRWGTGSGLMRYSPGYCGWDVSGQLKLFQHLQPQRIGIALRESFLMEPLKSISGVLIAGPREIHAFDDDYACCTSCETHDCRQRIQAMMAVGASQTRQGD